ncbi:hypothetical protein [Flavobacterium limi]|uniref:Uncharacterized protein n=1 Tax=Flavobacterium limi TaxID=2045105 RepID=A0ABQ1UVU7_9FLAO|nr:hypothetical protein [Flavobacterium limi]GGF28369.1 hypothetical protein GCM10011518_42110 [Flavobacterium limi]
MKTYYNDYDNHRDTNPETNNGSDYQPSVGDENNPEELLLASDNNYTDSEFSNAIESENQDDLQQDFDDSLEEDDFDESDPEDEEDYDENDYEELDDDPDEEIEPETFADDSQKID